MQQNYYFVALGKIISLDFTMNRYLIVGGGFHNKGAEAMLFTLITELRAKSLGCLKIKERNLCLYLKK